MLLGNKKLLITVLKAQSYHLAGWTMRCGRETCQTVISFQGVNPCSRVPLSTISEMKGKSSYCLHPVDPQTFGGILLPMIVSLKANVDLGCCVRLSVSRTTGLKIPSPSPSTDRANELLDGLDRLNLQSPEYQRLTGLYGAAKTEQLTNLPIQIKRDWKGKISHLYRLKHALSSFTKPTLLLRPIMNTREPCAF